MAKGRKIMTSRSERLLGSYGYNHGEESGGDGSELREDDVWSAVDDHFVNGSSEEWSTRATSESNGSTGGGYRSRTHPPQVNTSRHRRHVGGLSLAFDVSNDTTSPRIVHQYRAHEGVAASPRGRHAASSAPMNVPDWSKIYRVNSIESLHETNDFGDDHDSEWLPPHEYLAREYARTGKSNSNSVFEGVGRTLKGRDLSRVRDAVWSQTGFDG